MYRIKARAHVAFTYLAAVLEAGEVLPIMLPFLVLAWLSHQSQSLSRGRPRRWENTTHFC
jgi:hypothetical protein